MQEQEIPTINEDVEQIIPVEYDNEPIQGINATIQIGTTATGEAGTDASVENTGTPTHAILNFTIPRGDKGDTGDKGDKGDTGDSATIQMNATATTLSAGSQATATVTNSGDSHNANYTLALGIPQGVKGDRGERGVQGERGERGEQGIQGIQGIQGETGEAFSIYKTYPSVADMNADASNVPEGKFTLIASNVDDPDNSKLFVKNGEGTFTYLTDMSGAQGIQGERGEQGIQGIQGIQGPQGETGPRGSVKSQYVAELPASGDEDTFYLVDRDLESHTESGEYITLETTQTAGAIQSAQIDGNATQQTYSGKNLLGVHDGTTATFGGVTATRQSDGSILLNGTARENAWLEFGVGFKNGTSAQTTPYVLLDSTKTYTLSSSIRSGTYTSGGSTTNVTIQGNTVAPSNWSCDIRSSSPVTGANGIYRAYIRISTGDVFNNAVIQSQLELGSTATSYEPYVGGIPAPNPEFPQPISVVTGENVVKVVGKNLWNGAEPLAVTGYGTYALAKPLPAGTYTLSASSITTTGTGTYSLVMFLDSAGQTVASDSVFYSIKKRSFTLTGEATQVRIYSQGGYQQSQGVTTTFTNLQLESGSTATAYEPYTAQEFEVNLGKNLFSGFVTLATGSTFADGTLTMATSATNTSNDFAVQGSAAYYLNFDTPNQTRIYIREYDASGTMLVNTTKYVPYGFTTNANTKIVRVYFAPSTSEAFPVTVKDIQLEAGTQATDYADYFPPLELAKIPNTEYQDYPVKVNGKWYIEKQTGKIIFDSNNLWGWQMYQYGVSGYQFFKAMTVHHEANIVTTKSDYFVGGTVNNRGNTQNTVYTYNGGLAFNPAGITTLDDWKDWVTAHPTTVYYALATPTTTEITEQALIDQLEALASATLNQGVNNIWTEIATGNAMPTLELNWVEWEKYNRHNVYIWNDTINDWQIIVGMDGDS